MAVLLNWVRQIPYEPQVIEPIDSKLSEVLALVDGVVLDGDIDELVETLVSISYLELHQLQVLVDAVEVQPQRLELLDLVQVGQHLLELQVVDQHVLERYLLEAKLPRLSI
jgi:hypothetical protein